MTPKMQSTASSWHSGLKVPSKLIFFSAATETETEPDARPTTPPQRPPSEPPPLVPSPNTQPARPPYRTPDEGDPDTCRMNAA